MEKKVITRFAPSPTGFLHIGGLRTALYNYLFARHYRGKFLLRIEDTDQTRKIPGAIENLIKTLKTIGLEFDNKKPMIQSERLTVYRKFAEKLIKEDKAYYCFCSSQRLADLRKKQKAQRKPPMYDGLCRNLNSQEISKNLKTKKSYVIRQKIPKNKIIEFTDLVKGKIQINSNILDDQILLKTDSWPTYHLASVVDDYEMKVSQVIRGEEWISSTPKHILLYEAFGWPVPQFAHLPLILNPNRIKLSKRQADIAIEEYLKKGYLPEVLLNFILLLGWNPGNNREIFSLKEMIKEFDLVKVNKSGAIFNLEKLDWLNGWYLRHTNLDELIDLCLPYLVESGLISSSKLKAQSSKLKKIVVLEQERMRKLSELPQLAEYFFEKPQYEMDLLRWKNQGRGEVKKNLEILLEFLKNLSEKKFDKVNLEKEIKKLIAEKNLGVGETLWPMRVALSGRKASPSPFEIAEILGKEETLERIKEAISL